MENEILSCSWAQVASTIVDRMLKYGVDKNKAISSIRMNVSSIIKLRTGCDAQFYILTDTDWEDLSQQFALKDYALIRVTATEVGIIQCTKILEWPKLGIEHTSRYVQIQTLVLLGET